MPNILILTATSAANCGISSNDLTRVKHKGIPFNLYDVVKEMGRADRTQTLDNCSYKVYMSFPCLVSTFSRIMTSPDANERTQLVKGLHDVLRLLIVSTQCYDSQIENHFNWEDRNLSPCNSMCSYCLRHCSNFTRLVVRKQIESVLCMALLQNKKATPDSLQNAITKHKSLIFESTISSAGPIHALLLQLYANGIFKLYISDNNVIGTEKIMKQHILADMVYAKDVDNSIKPAYRFDAFWFWQGIIVISWLLFTL